MKKIRNIILLLALLLAACDNTEPKYTINKYGEVVEKIDTLKTKINP